MSIITTAVQWLAISAALVCIGASACRLHKMDPVRNTSWVWLGLYIALFALAWYALAMIAMGNASTFDQAACILAAAYLLLTIRSWRSVPAVVRKDKGRPQ